MKPGSITTGRLLIAFCVIGTTLALVSWDRKQAPSGFQQQLTESGGQTHDTIPQKKDKKIRDLDEAIAELESIDMKIHMEKAMEEVNKAMKEIDGEKIRLEVEKAMKEVDFAKIQAEVDKAMKEIDFAKIEKEVKESIAKIDWNKMKAELDEAKKIDLSEMEAGLAEAREEIKKIKPELEKELQKAKVEIEKAKAEMKGYKSFVDGLEKDGLINKKENYSIKHKNGKLTINDKEASSVTYEKYRGFLDKHKEFNIEKDNDDFDIDMD